MSLELQDLFDISFALLYMYSSTVHSRPEFQHLFAGRMSHEQCPRRSSNVEEVVGE